MRRFAAHTALAAILLAMAGCGEPKQVTGWQNPLDTMEKTLPAETQNPNYVLTRMEYARLAIEMGCYSRAKTRLEEAFNKFDSNQSNIAAAIGSERNKYYKGETYERAMVCWYMGYITYQALDYNNARIYFARALAEDRKAVVSKDTPEVYGDDFGLAYYWLGKAYLKLGDSDNARIAFQKSVRVSPREQAADELAKDKQQALAARTADIQGEQWCLKTFGNPQEQALYISGLTDLRAAYEEASRNDPASRPAEGAAPEIGQSAKDANLVLTIELGSPPYKYLSGIQNETTNVGRPMVYPSQVVVSIDGQPVGPAAQVLDLWHQASTQDRILEKEGIQTGKALLKTAMEMMGSQQSNWDVSGDARYWMSLRGKTFVYSARVPGGVHTISLRMYDANGKVLPRWTNTYYGIAAPAAGESCVLLCPRYNGDNQLPADLAAKALKAGATYVEP